MITFEQFAFYIFSGILVFASVMVISIRNPVKAALFLVLAFFSAACVWMTLEAEFLAIVLVLVLRWRGNGVVPVRGDDVGH